MVQSSKKYSNLEKSAIVIMSLGEDLAAEIIRQLPSRDAQRILETISRFGKIDESVATEIQKEFYDLVSNSKPTQKGDPTVAKRIIMKAFGTENSEQYLNSIAQDIPQSFKDAENVDSKSLQQILAKEANQTIAIILAHLSSKKAGEVIAKFSTEQRVEILLRMSVMQEVERSILDDIDEPLSRSIEALRRKSTTQIGGIEKTVALLQTMNTLQREELLARLTETTPDIAEAIKSQLWTFDDISKLQSSDIEKILRKALPIDLELALRKASDELKSKIFKSMSERRAKEMQESILIAKPAPMAKVEEAQRRIALLAAKMIQEGEIMDPNVQAL